jgi:hypothetical protein
MNIPNKGLLAHRASIAVVITIILMSGCDQRKQNNTPVDTTIAPARTAAAAPPAAAIAAGEGGATQPSFSPELIAAYTAAFDASPPSKASVQRDSDSVELTFEPVSLVPVGDVVALLAAGEIRDGSHADVGSLAVIYLKHAGSGYQRVGRWLDVSQGGGWGLAPQASTQRDLLQWPVILAKTGWSGQGCTIEKTDLIELTPQGPKVRAAVPTGYENGDSAFDGKIQASDNRTQFRVVYTGTSVGSGRTVIYKAGSGKFEPTPTVDDLPGC